MSNSLNRNYISLEISRHHWAITEPALRSIIGFIDSEEQLTFETFHSEEHKPVAYFGSEVEGSYYSYKNGNVGVLSIDGPIIPRATWLSRASGITSVDVMTDEFKAMLADDSIEEIVLAMDTPGGVTTGISDFASLVKSSTKKVTAFTWMAASAGYWIASAADEIISPVGGMVGSIGVVMSYTDTTERDKKAGVVTREIVSSQSPNKRASLDTENGKIAIQQLLDDLADGFIGTVADNRNKTKEQVMESFGAGAVFAEQRALSVGMIDSVSDFESMMNSKSKQPKQLVGFNMEGKQNMSDEQKVEAQNPQDIARAERERIQGIESLMSLVEGKHPDIVKAAGKVIDTAKYEDGSTKESVEPLVLKAVVGAQDALVAELEAKHKDGVEAAETASKAVQTAKSDSAEDAKLQAETDELVAVAKEGNKR